MQLPFCGFVIELHCSSFVAYFSAPGWGELLCSLDMAPIVVVTIYIYWHRSHFYSIAILSILPNPNFIHAFFQHLRFRIPSGNSILSKLWLRLFKLLIQAGVKSGVVSTAWPRFLTLVMGAIWLVGAGGLVSPPHVFNPSRQSVLSLSTFWL